jgi:hypothetical protein
MGLVFVTWIRFMLLVLWIDTGIYQTAVVTARPSTLHLRRWQCLDPSWRLSDHFGSLCKKWSLWMPLRSFETEMLKCFQWLSIRSGRMWISHWLHLDISQKCIQINDSVIQAFLVPRPTVPPHLEEREHQWFGTVQHIQSILRPSVFACLGSRNPTSFVRIINWGWTWSQAPGNVVCLVR